MIKIKEIIYLFVILFSINSSAQQLGIQNITEENGLPSNSIYAIQQDEIGYLWISTSKGLVKYDGNDFTQINKLKTTSVFIEDETIYSGLENGLFLKNKSKETFLESKKVLKIFSFDNEIFVGTTQGISQLRASYLQPLQINTLIDFSQINDIIFYNNNFYIATNKGLWKVNRLLNPDSIKRITADKSVSLLQFQDKIIVATENNGIQLIAENNSVVRIIETLNNISSIAKLKNEIWVTSKTDGIEVLVLPSFSFKQKINRYNSLGTNQINNVLRDNQNTKWVSTAKGIYKLNSPSSLSLNISKPKIYFESLLVNNQILDSLLGKDDLIKLSSELNNISIHFKSINLSNPRNVEYRFKLDKEFSTWSKNNLVQFANLNPGKYKFQVQSRNNENESSIESLSFVIDSPFYKKAWFLFSVIISLLLIAYFSLDLYIKQLHKNHEEKVSKLKIQNHLLTLEQKALQLQMNPHFIFNVLNGIKALGISGKTDEFNSTISKFSVLLRGILNNSRKEEITLKEEINLLKNYIELEQRMSSKYFTYQIITNLNNIDSDEILIPSMLIQPFVENCIHHAFGVHKEGSIKIDFKIEYGFLLCSILDNGIGYIQSQKQKNNSSHKSVALDVSKERLNTISNKSSFSMSEVKKDKKIQGTKVSFRIPLKTDF